MGRVLMIMRKLWASTAVFIALIILFSAVPLLSEEAKEAKDQQKSAITEVSASGAAALIEKNSGNPDFIILDVRTPGEYSEGHIDNAVNLDVNSGSFSEEVVKLDRENTYLIHCRSGSRSEKAGAMMEELGFINIYEIGGGFVEWESEGHPVSK